MLEADSVPIRVVIRYHSHAALRHVGMWLGRDVRAAVDRCHRDGSLKNAVAADPAKYIHEACAILPIFNLGAMKEASC